MMPTFKEFLLSEQMQIKFPGLYPLLKRPDTNIAKFSKLSTEIPRYRGHEVSYTSNGEFYPQDEKGRFGWAKPGSERHEGFHYLMDVVYEECEDCYNHILDEFEEIYTTGLKSSIKKFDRWLRERGYDTIAIDEREEFVIAIQDIITKAATRQAHLDYMGPGKFAEQYIGRLKRIWKAMNELAKSYYWDGDTLEQKTTVEEIIKNHLNAPHRIGKRNVPSAKHIRRKNMANLAQRMKP